MLCSAGSSRAGTSDSQGGPGPPLPPPHVAGTALNHSESEGVCVNCLSSLNKLQTRFSKQPGGLFVVLGEIRYKIGAVTRISRDQPSQITGRSQKLSPLCSPQSLEKS